THAAGTHTQTELAELFDISRATVYRELQRALPPQAGDLASRRRYLLSCGAP
ncbi:helix-turn-helix domain-containing protein, partial [Leucobacter sp. NPDC077196]|uniref:helix-turn-helix domain-containing protein n=1 Tax=Leucobacter sp. NPDC077196 TaxID=3154959 RepID=UPI003433A477